MSDYPKYLQSDDWKAKRLAKLYRKSGSKKRCAICASKENLAVHHVLYRPNLAEVKQSELRVVCERCHNLAHKLYSQGAYSFWGAKGPNARWTIQKHAVKKHLGILKVNMFKNHL